MQAAPEEKALWQHLIDIWRESGLKPSAWHRQIRQTVQNSLVESVKANGMKPYAYLDPILKELLYADTPNKVDGLLS